MKIPPGAIGALNGLFYKIGIHGKVFYWNNGGWILSAKTAEVLHRALDKKEDKFGLIDCAYSWA